MRPEILDFVQRDGLIFVAAAAGWRLVVLRERAEGADLDFAGGDGPVGVDDDSQEGIHVGLLQHLRGDIDPGEPAAVARVAVIPPDGVFHPPVLAAGLEILHDVFVGFGGGVDSGFGAFDG